MSDLKSILIVVSALGSGLVGGIFFAFSNFVMKALARVPPAQAVSAMQSINVVVLNKWFFAVFFWDRGVLFGACHFLVRSLAKTGRGLSARRQPALSHRYDPGDNRMQRAAERCARPSRPIECRRWSRVNRVSQEVDGLESPADGSGPGRRSFVYRWTLSRCFTVRFGSSQSVVDSDVHKLTA